MKPLSEVFGLPVRCITLLIEEAVNAALKEEVEDLKKKLSEMTNVAETDEVPIAHASQVEEDLASIDPVRNEAESAENEEFKALKTTLREQESELDSLREEKAKLLKELESSAEDLNRVEGELKASEELVEERDRLRFEMDELKAKLDDVTSRESSQDGEFKMEEWVVVIPQVSDSTSNEKLTGNYFFQCISE